MNNDNDVKAPETQEETQEEMSVSLKALREQSISQDFDRILEALSHPQCLLMGEAPDLTDFQETVVTAYHLGREAMKRDLKERQRYQYTRRNQRPL